MDLVAEARLGGARHARRMTRLECGGRVRAHEGMPILGPLRAMSHRHRSEGVATPAAGVVDRWWIVRKEGAEGDGEMQRLRSMIGRTEMPGTESTRCVYNSTLSAGVA